MTFHDLPAVTGDTARAAGAGPRAGESGERSVSMPRPAERLDDDQPLFDVPDSAVVAVVAEVRLRAFYRGYAGAQTTRLHVERDTPVRRYSSTAQSPKWPESWCGVTASPTRQSQTIYVDPLPTHPPDGLEWCAKCLGHLAERLGMLGEVGQLLAAAAA